MNMKRPWIPTNRCTVRICVVLFRACRNDRITLSFRDFDIVRDGTFRTRFNPTRRAYLGRLWRVHGGLELARSIDAVDRIPPDVIEELEQSA